MTKSLVESLRETDAFNEAYETATGCILGAHRVVNARKIHASHTLGEESDIVQHYKDELQMLHEQHQLILKFDSAAIADAPRISAEFKKKYGDKSIRDLNINDHILAKPNGPG